MVINVESKDHYKDIKQKIEVFNENEENSNFLDKSVEK